VRAYVPPPPAIAIIVPQPPPAPLPAPTTGEQANRPPMVRASCNPCVLQAGGTATLRADMSDPDGDPLTVYWTATSGTISDVRVAVTQWKAGTAPGLVTFTVTVNDGRGGTASDKVTIEVSAGEEQSFPNVLFDFDSSAIRQDAIPTLDAVIAAMKANPNMQVQIQGHTCNIGTAEYNLALGERRATAVRNYLVQRGIAVSRLSTISYGEERPAHSNAQESTRRLNRRAEFVVHATDSLAPQ
jgi:peptidoglycan-associated lipoprotein